FRVGVTDAQLRVVAHALGVDRLQAGDVVGGGVPFAVVTVGDRLRHRLGLALVHVVGDGPAGHHPGRGVQREVGSAGPDGHAVHLGRCRTGPGPGPAGDQFLGPAPHVVAAGDQRTVGVPARV